MSFNENLRSARERKHLTQQQVADLLGIDKSTYCGYETGKRQPDVPKLKNILKILDISGDELLETGRKNAPDTTEAVPGAVDKTTYERALRLYKALISAGFLREGEDLTPEQVDVLDGLSTIISAMFD